MATVGPHYVKASLVGAARRGLAVDKLVIQAGIDPKILNQPATRVHTRLLGRLIRILWRELGDEFLGFTQQRSEIGTFSLMCKLVSRSDNLGLLLQQGMDFYNTLAPDLQMSWLYIDTESKSTSTTSLTDLPKGLQQLGIGFQFKNPELDPNHFFLEFWMVIWHRFISWYAGKYLPLHQVELTYTPTEYHDEFQWLFRCPLKTNSCIDSFWFNKELLELPLIKSQQDLKFFLASAPDALLTMPTNDNRIAARVTSLLLQHGLTLEAEDICQQLQFSQQTLRRLLRLENTHFQKIKDQLRRDLAIDKLIHQKESITTIASKLGFSETRSFSRAFKHWTNFSPGKYRRKHSPSDKDNFNNN